MHKLLRLSLATLISASLLVHANVNAEQPAELVARDAFTAFGPDVAPALAERDSDFASSNEIEERGAAEEDCDDEPATVYVTVTVDGQGQPSGGAGGGGGGGKCTEGCYTGSVTDTSIQSSPTGGAGAAPTHTTSSDEWDDWGGATGSASSSSSSASASGSSGAGSGSGDGFSAASTNLQGLSILVSLGVCAFTSLATMWLFTAA